MKPFAPLLILAALALSLPARADITCSSKDGGQTVNWPIYRERVQRVFDTVKAAAGEGIDPQLELIYINDLPKQSGTRLVDGSPLSAMQKGTLGLEHDAIIYTYVIFEIACDEAQLAFFMSHEMRHIKRGDDGKNHMDRVSACRKGLFTPWVKGIDLSSYYPAKTGNPALDDAAEKAGNKKVMAAFDKEKGHDVAIRCVKPVENEADAYAIQLEKKLPYKFDSDPVNPNPSLNEGVQAFRRARDWDPDANDPAHGTAAEREETARKAVTDEALKNLKDREDRALQSLPRNF